MWVEGFQERVERHWKSADRLRGAGVTAMFWGSNIYVVLAELHEERARKLEKEARIVRAGLGR